MRFSRWIDGGARRDCGTGPGPRRAWNARAMRPACEARPDGRQLLSTSGRGCSRTPPSAAVANAAADLNTLDPTTSSPRRIQRTDLARAESHSHVTAAQSRRAGSRTKAAIDQSDRRGRGRRLTLTKGHVNDVQNVFADAFLAGPYQTSGCGRHSSFSRDIDRMANGGQAVASPGAHPGPRSWGWCSDRPSPSVPGANSLIPGTVSPRWRWWDPGRQGSHLRALRTALALDRLHFEYELGPKPDADLRPGACATDRDPLEVYLDGQVNNFTKG